MTLHNLRKGATNVKTIVNSVYNWCVYFQWTGTWNMLLCVSGTTGLTEKCVNVPRCDRWILLDIHSKALCHDKYLWSVLVRSVPSYELIVAKTRPAFWILDLTWPLQKNKKKQTKKRCYGPARGANALKLKEKPGCCGGFHSLLFQILEYSPLLFVYCCFV